MWAIWAKYLLPKVLKSCPIWSHWTEDTFDEEGGTLDRPSLGKLKLEQRYKIIFISFCSPRPHHFFFDEREYKKGECIFCT